MNSADFEKRKSKNKIQTFIDEKNSVHTALTIKIWILFWFGYLKKSKRLDFFRHHMAVYSFKQLTDSGLDMYVALPILSTYLGHKNILATERYVRLTLQLFPYIEEKFRCMVDQVFGGMADENN